MTEFVYNRAKNTNTGYISSKFNYRYQPRISYKKDVDSRSKFVVVDKLTEEIRNLMVIYSKNL